MARCVLFLLLFLFSNLANFVAEGNSNVDGGARANKLLDATSSGDIQGMINSLKYEGINSVDINGWSAAAFAVAASNPGALKFLIANGIDLNTPTKEGYTPLMMAARQSDRLLVEMLLEANADPTIRTQRGETATSIAHRSKRLLIAAIILEASVIRGIVSGDENLVLDSIREGAFVNHRTSGGWTPLIFACAGGHTEIADELIVLGGDVDSADKDGWTALHFAAFNGHRDVVKLLVENGANIYVANNQGQAPKALALSQRFSEIVSDIEAAEGILARRANYNDAHEAQVAAAAFAALAAAEKGEGDSL